MKCPHCLTAFHEQKSFTRIGADRDGTWATVSTVCPTCERIIVTLISGTPVHVGPTLNSLSDQKYARFVYPQGYQRAPCPEEVKTESADIASDYEEACLVLPDSPKASAALSRRCLQHVLKEKAGTTERDLFDQIQEVLDSGQVPSHLTESLDAVRVIGNFAAHPMKSKSSGEIVEVEPGEAEWNLDALEKLFDFYWVQPAIGAAKRAALNKKLTDAGKPPLKSSARS